MLINTFFRSIYTSDLVGRACLKSQTPVHHYSDLAFQMGGKYMREIVGVAFALQLTLVTGSHVITGSIALNTLATNKTVCALVWAVISGIVLVS
jgi:Transmembrane amino acid transporter protein